MLCKRFADMCPDTNSSLGIDKSFFAKRDFDVISPWLTHDSWQTTAYTAVETPFLLASPKA
jgi:hypothetical protein